MDAGTAWSILGETLTLSVGLVVIGWAKYRARVAYEAWQHGDGPRNRQLLVDLHAGVDQATANLRAARLGMQAALAQVQKEVR